MTLERREFLRLAGLVAGGSAMSACSPLYTELSGVPRGMSAWSPISASDYRVLSRLTYGPTPSEREQITRIGWQSWVERQLAPDSIEDAGVRWRLRTLDSLEMNADALALWEKEDVTLDLKRAALLRRVYSERQLQERMVEFWTDHFNISVMKGDCWFLKVVDDLEVIRKHAMGNFRDLLWSSAHSPAMLVYLDNQANESSAPNENYARELMELHTLGVEGGYSQQDVMELARCLTGWSVKDHFWLGQFTFNEDAHDPGSKVVLGKRIEPAGQREAELVLEELATHPATAHHISSKLVRRFISEDPRPKLVEGAAQTFLRSNGSIASVLEHVLFDGLRDAEAKVKRPFDLIASGLRIMAADTDGGQPLQSYLDQMGQPAFEWPTPDGPPDNSSYWTSNLLARWRFGAQLALNQIEGTTVELETLLSAGGGGAPESAFDQLTELLLGMPLDRQIRNDLFSALRDGGATDDRTMMELTVAGLVASPGFQWM